MKILISFTLLILSFTANAIGISEQFNPSSSPNVRNKVYKVVCGAAAVRIYANIREQLAIIPNIQFIWVYSGGVHYPYTYDATDGDGSISAWTSGPYASNPSYVYVQNSYGLFNNPEKFEGNIQCKKADNTAATTTITLIQNP
jgi:hypothetical protein